MTSGYRGAAGGIRGSGGKILLLDLPRATVLLRRRTAVDDAEWCSSKQARMRWWKHGLNERPETLIESLHIGQSPFWKPQLEPSRIVIPGRSLISTCLVGSGVGAPFPGHCLSESGAYSEHAGPLVHCIPRVTAMNDSGAVLLMTWRHRRSRPAHSFTATRSGQWRPATSQ